MQKSKESNSYRDGSEEWDNGGCWGRRSENNNTTLGGNQGKQRSECGMQLAFVHVLENKDLTVIGIQLGLLILIGNNGKKQQIFQQICCISFCFSHAGKYNIYKILIIIV